MKGKSTYLCLRRLMSNHLTRINIALIHLAFITNNNFEISVIAVKNVEQFPSVMLMNLANFLFMLRNDLSLAYYLAYYFTKMRFNDLQ